MTIIEIYSHMNFNFLSQNNFIDMIVKHNNDYMHVIIFNIRIGM